MLIGVRDGDYIYIPRNDGTAMLYNYTGEEEGDLMLPASLGGYTITDLDDSVCSNASMKTLVIPETVVVIGENAFNTCENLTSVVINGPVTEIPEYAFAWCENLTTVVLPDSVTSIDSGAFAGCSSLTSLEIPAGVTYIGEDAFQFCYDLILSVAPGSYAETFARSNGIDYSNGTDKPYPEPTDEPVAQATLPPDAPEYLFDYTALGAGEVEIYDYNGSADHVVIPEELDGCKVVSIASYALSYDNFSTIEIPSTVAKLGEGVFSDAKLTSITLPDSIVSLEPWTLAFCEQLSSVTLPDTMTHIGDNVFSWSSALSYVHMPASLTYIGVEAFNGCQELTSLEIPASVTFIGEDAFLFCDNLTLTVVPGSYAETYARNNGINYVYAGGSPVQPTATPTPAVPDVPTLTVGNSGEAVKALQILLIEHNYLDDVADGQFGRKTEDGVRAVQTEAGLEVTGVADAATQAYLADHSRAFEATQRYAIKFYAIKRDDDTGEVRVCIKNLGLSEITAISIRLFQCDSGKNPIGDFYGRRNTSTDEYWTTINSSSWALASGDTDYALLDIREGAQVQFTGGNTRTVEFFVNNGYIGIELTGYTTEDGEEHSASQTLYCPFH